MRIADGQPEQHPAPLPVDSSVHQVAPQTPVATAPTGPTIPGRDTTGEYQQQQAAGVADVRAAQQAGMAAEHDRRGRYAGQVGSDYGDAVALPVAPDNAVPPAGSYGYPWPGDEPVPAGAG